MCLLVDFLLQVRLDLCVLGEALFLELRVNEIPVEGHLKAAPTRWDQRECFNVLLECFQNLVRQTDGLVFVASLCAVFDFELHAYPPSCWCDVARLYNCLLLFGKEAAICSTVNGVSSSFAAFSPLSQSSACFSPKSSRSTVCIRSSTACSVSPPRRRVVPAGQVNPCCFPCVVRKRNMRSEIERGKPVSVST